MSQFAFCDLMAQSQMTAEQAMAEFERNVAIYKEETAKNGRKFESYAYYYFRGMDLLPYLDDPEFVLNYLHQTGYNMHSLELPKQVLETYNLLFDYHDKFEKRLDKKTKETYVIRRSFDYGIMAEAYIKLGKIDSAEQMHLKNIKFIKPLNDTFYASAMNNYGLFLIAEKSDYDLAMENFLNAKELVEHDPEQEHFYGSIIDNIADVYRYKEDHEKALSLYLENFERYSRVLNFNGKNLDYPRLISAGCQAMDLALVFDNNALWDSIDHQIHSIALNKYDWKKLLPDSRLEYLNVKANKSKYDKDYKMANSLLLEANRLSDSLVSVSNADLANKKGIMNNLTLERIRSKFALEKAEKEAKIVSQRKNLWILSLVAILGLMILSFLLYRRRKKTDMANNKRLMAEQELELTTLKNQQLKFEIEAKKKDLTDFAINLSQSQEWAKNLNQQMIEIKGSKGRLRAKLLDQMQEEIENKTNFDTNTKEFYDRLDKLSASFYSHLNDRFEQLTKTDRRLCSLIRLGVDSHDIATLQNISLASLNTARYRLRKKLDLSEDQNLDDFIQSL